MEEKKIGVFVIGFILVTGGLVVLADMNSERQSPTDDEEAGSIGKPVARWTFDEGSGAVVHDVSGNGFHGTLHGGTWISGPLNGALALDGDDDYVEITQNTSAMRNRLAELGQGSISVWFRVNHIPTGHGIAPIFYYGAEEPCTNFFDAANQGLIIEAGHSPIHRGSQRLYFTIWANGCTYPSFCYDSWHPLSENEWYHFVAVVGENYNTGYLNGEEMVDRNYNFGTSSYSQFFENAVKHEALWMGRGYWDAVDDPTPLYTEGAIDDIRIYDQPLSSQEISDLYSERNDSENSPPDAPSITGPSSGKKGQEYIYTFAAADPDGDKVYYQVEWGGGCPGIEWRGPYPSGEPMTFSNTWQTVGIYVIRARAMDTTGEKSPWETLSVSMPKSFSVGSDN